MRVGGIFFRKSSKSVSLGSCNYTLDNDFGAILGTGGNMGIGPLLKNVRFFIHSHAQGWMEIDA